MRILFWGLWEMPGKWLAPIHRVGSLWSARFGRNWLVWFPMRSMEHHAFNMKAGVDVENLTGNRGRIIAGE